MPRVLALAFALLLSASAPAQDTRSAGNVHGNYSYSREDLSAGASPAIRQDFDVQPAAATEPAPAPAEPISFQKQKSGKALPLTGPSADDAKRRLASGSVTTMLGSLGVVVGLFLLVVWVFKRSMPRTSMLLPSEAVEVLGRTPLAPRQFAHLVRCGNKLLLVSISPGGAETLSEITDPEEVDRLIALCQGTRTAGPGFRQVFENLGRQPREGSLRVSADDQIDLSSLAKLNVSSAAKGK